MSIVHRFVSAKSDGGDTTLVRPSDWNNTHSLTGICRTEISVVGTTGFTLYHNLNDTRASLIGWSSTWNTGAYVGNVGLTNMSIIFSNPSATVSDIFISNVEIT